MPRYKNSDEMIITCWIGKKYVKEGLLMKGVLWFGLFH